VEITEVRVKLMEEAGERLQAFCSITFDNCFVIRDLKIIEGASGPFVAMPSRKLTAHCHQCGCKNHLRAAYCNQCGARLKDDRVVKEEDGRAKLYADIAHPINSQCREMIQQRVVRAFEEEVEKAKLPGYVSRYEDFEQDVDDLMVSLPQRHDPVTPRPAARPARHDASATPPPHVRKGSAPSHGPHKATPAPAIAAPAMVSPPERSANFGEGIF
jgi:stage V sporulation protein G